MPLDLSFVGRSLPPMPPYQVGREKIREFAIAIRATDPVHHDVEAAKAAGHADVVGPPTFPIVMTLPALMEQIVKDPRMGIDYSRVVHGDQRFAYERPVVAGDELIVVNTIEDFTSRGGHNIFTTRQEIRTTSGELVVTVWQKTVVRGE